MEPFKIGYIRLDEENLPEFTQLLTSTQGFDPSSQLLIGCLCNGIPCAMAAASIDEEKYARLDWLEVVGGLRRRGIGSALLSSMLQCLRRLGAFQITAAVSASFPGAEELKAFLLKNGFDPPVATQMVYFASFDDVLPCINREESQLLPKMDSGIQPLSNLDATTEKLLKRAVKDNRIPPFVLPENAVGILLDEYSLAYTEDKNVCAAVMYTELPHVLYLNSLYINILHHKEGMRLVFYTLNKALGEYNKANVLALDVINPRSLALVEHFTARFPHRNETRYAMRKIL